jgi:hypothetical protein
VTTKRKAALIIGVCAVVVSLAVPLILTAFPLFRGVFLLEIPAFALAIISIAVGHERPYAIQPDDERDEQPTE